MKATRRQGLALALLLGATTYAAAAEKLVYAGYMGDNYTISKTDIWVMSEIEKRSNGEITFERYFNGTLLKAPDLYPGLRSGAADIVSGTPAAYNRNEYRLSNVVLPYISSKADAVSKALNDLYQSNDAFRDEFESRNAKLLYAVPWSENTFWGIKPLAKPEDFKGQKIRAVQSIATIVGKLDATPVAVAWPEAVEGLSRGIVDAVSSSPFDSAIYGGIYEQAKYASDAGDNGIFSFVAISINKNRWAKLSDAHKKIIEEVAAEAPAHYLKLLDESLDYGVDKLCAIDKDKLRLLAFTEADRKQMHDVIGPEIHEEWVKWAGQTGKVDTAALLKEYVGLVRKYEPQSTWRSGFQRLAERNCIAS
ncbi:TRAP transporter substrate-binding protein DctP [Alcaligenaceae bacterium]|nr:TRAP transporter substrate-binding protein DctP [Alcaligenaceae bacterium]